MNIDKIIEKILKDCLDVKPRENILVVTDTEKESIGKAIFKKAIQMGLETTLVIKGVNDHLEILLDNLQTGILRIFYLFFRMIKMGNLNTDKGAERKNYDYLIF
ncbi:hypothetical protein ES708_13059 [subsurface metagenome]